MILSLLEQIRLLQYSTWYFFIIATFTLQVDTLNLRHCCKWTRLLLIIAFSLSSLLPRILPSLTSVHVGVICRTICYKVRYKDKIFSLKTFGNGISYLFCIIAFRVIRKHRRSPSLRQEYLHSSRIVIEKKVE
jgi:hypothetical protein